MRSGHRQFKAPLVAAMTTILAVAATNGALLLAQDDLPSAPSPAPSPALPQADAITSQPAVEWSRDYEAALRSAIRDQRPILVRGGADYCTYCRQLESEIAKPAVQLALANWTLVSIDVELQPDIARDLGVSAIPALRILTPAGQRIAARDGYLTADQLTAWLAEHQELATFELPDELASSERPSTIQVVRLLRQFKLRDAALREACVRRLRPHPDVAAVAVAAAFAEGSLSTRLATLELLTHWQAPVEGLDPWRSETITEERLAAIEKWALEAPTAPDELAPRDATAEELNDEQLADVDRMIAFMNTGTPAEAMAIREQLARYGPTLLPHVYDRLKTVDDDLERERLAALRYRLVASDGLALRWRGGVELLAARETSVRQQAASELSRRATAIDEPLLLELFSDPDPLVRELSLRGLQRVSGAGADSALVRLLDDPEPNVRAAVLKQLAAEPNDDVVPAIADYVAQESDADLVVHAVRVLREVGSEQSIDCLSTLLTHSSWQVRAEATEAVGKATEERYDSGEYRAKSLAKLLNVLNDEDSFVVSRAIEALQGSNLPSAVERIAATADQRPELAETVVKALGEFSSQQQVAAEYVKKFTSHENPRVRAAAINGLTSLAATAIEKHLLAAVQDSESIVRMAAADSIFTQVENQRTAFTHHDFAISGGSPRPPLGPFGTPVDWMEEDIEPVEADQAGNVIGNTLKWLFGIKRQVQDEAALEEMPDEEMPDEEMPDEEMADEEMADEEMADEEMPDEEMPDEIELPAVDATSPESIEPADVIEVVPSGELVSGEDKTTDAANDEQPTGASLENTDTVAKARAAIPQWILPLKPHLTPMLTAETQPERVAAALALAALGETQTAMETVQVAVAKHQYPVGKAGDILVWLGAEDRYALFGLFCQHAAGSGDLGLIAESMCASNDPESIERVWKLFHREDMKPDAVSGIYQSLVRHYFRNQSYSPERLPPAVKQRVAQQMAQRLEDGVPWERLVALSILHTADLDKAAESSDRLANDSNQPDWLRLDAFKIALLSRSKLDANALACDAIQGPDRGKQMLAMRYLAFGEPAVRTVSGGYLYLRGATTVYANERPAFEAPKELTADDLRPLLERNDPELAALAGYFLCLLGEPDGLSHLVNYYYRQETGDWSQLTARAIAVLDDASQVPVLEHIYLKLKASGDYSMAEFYWTIRTMTGERILALRKRMRDEIGMEALNVGF